MQCCFHTTMVLTQPGRWRIKGGMPGFHTTMVLTQLWPGSEVRIYVPFPYHYGSHATMGFCGSAMLKVVSIPLWFSRNAKAKALIKHLLLFPYHYGSHATCREQVFHTNRIQFPYHYGSHATKWFCIYCFLQHVSIPLWFSRNQVVISDLLNLTMFPYHYGSHAT